MSIKHSVYPEQVFEQHRKPVYVNDWSKVSKLLYEGGIMKGDIISKEFQKMVWVQDKDGKEYACYIEDLGQIKKKEDMTEEEQKQCLDLNTVLGDSW